MSKRGKYKKKRSIFSKEKERFFSNLKDYFAAAASALA